MKRIEVTKKRVVLEDDSGKETILVVGDLTAQLKLGVVIDPKDLSSAVTQAISEKRKSIMASSIINKEFKSVELKKTESEEYRKVLENKVRESLVLQRAKARAIPLFESLLRSIKADVMTKLKENGLCRNLI